MRAWLRRTLLLVVAGVAIVLPGDTADHRDAPGISEDGRADILDVYGFVNPNNGHLVLALTVNPFVVAGSPGVAFAPDVLYEFKIDNTGDNVEDLVIQTTFTPSSPAPQQFEVRGPEAPRITGSTSVLLRSPPSAAGPATGVTVAGAGPVTRAFAGLRDDPFFLDLIWVFRQLGIQPGGPLARDPGIDFFAGLNCSILAVEVPAAAVRGPTGNVIRVWGATSRGQQTIRSGSVYLEDTRAGPYIQVDRMALPVVSTVLMPTRLKDAFNRARPTQDHVFRAAAIDSLVALNGDRGYSTTLVDAVLLPDVLTVDLTRTDGFLNGRRPQDDVIDVVLQAATRGAVTTDGVDANDVPFLTDFPFFAPPHPPERPVPPRNR